VSKKKKGKKKHKQSELRGWEEIREQVAVDERCVAGYARLMEAEEILYKRWERDAPGMSWVGELLGFPIEEEGNLWLMALGEKVAALGGYLEVTAVFADERVTLLREPGPGEDPEAYRPLERPTDDPEA
jgi:hypothetical protein